MAPHELLVFRVEEDDGRIKASFTFGGDRGDSYMLPTQSRGPVPDLQSPLRVVDAPDPIPDGSPLVARSVGGERRSSPSPTQMMVDIDPDDAAGPSNIHEDALDMVEDAYVQPAEEDDSDMDLYEEDKRPMKQQRKRPAAPSSTALACSQITTTQALDEIAQIHWPPCDRCLSHLRSCNDPQCKKPQHSCKGPGGSIVGATRCPGCQQDNAPCS